jgi:hypothetical protein
MPSPPLPELRRGLVLSSGFTPIAMSILDIHRVQQTHAAKSECTRRANVDPSIILANPPHTRRVKSRRALANVTAWTRTITGRVHSRRTSPRRSLVALLELLADRQIKKDAARAVL